MKKIVYSISVILALAAVVSCEKKLDSEQQLGALDSTIYYANANDSEAEALSTSMYISVKGLYNTANMDSYTDDFVSTSVYKTVNADGFGTGYSNYYQLIYKANLIIENLKDDTPVKKRVIGEAYFMRGWSYFKLIRAWGNPPYVDHVLDSSELSEITNGNTTELWQLCFSSFEKAIELLPAKSGRGGQKALGGRVSKQTAQAYLGKARLQAGDKAGAASVLKQVIDSNAYDLVADYSDLYTIKADWCDEYIWEFNASDSDPDQRSNESMIPYNSNWRQENLTMPGGCHLSGFNQGYSTSFPSKDYYDFMIAREGKSNRLNGTAWSMEDAAHKFVELSDPSLEGSLNYEGGNLAAMRAKYPGLTDDQLGMHLLWTDDMARSEVTPCQGILFAKVYMWHSDMFPATQTQDLYSMANYPIMRYSDVLLMYAEAAQDVGALNKVRQRAGLAPLSAYSDQDLRDERRAEFWGEGERFWDCVRWGIAATKFAKVGSITYVTSVNSADCSISVSTSPVSDWVGWSEKYTKFPYPTSEIQQTKIQQAPEW